MSDEKKLRAKELFTNYTAADAKVDALQVQLEEAMRERSDVVKAVYEEVGPGPFNYQGSQVIAMARGTRAGSKSFFLRGKKEKNKPEILDVG